jgi:hypothetical protein
MILCNSFHFIVVETASCNTQSQWERTSEKCDFLWKKINISDIILILWPHLSKGSPRTNPLAQIASLQCCRLSVMRSTHYVFCIPRKGEQWWCSGRLWEVRVTAAILDLVSFDYLTNAGVDWFDFGGSLGSSIFTMFHFSINLIFNTPTDNVPLGGGGHMPHLALPL